jgi:hypothetical protein
VDRLVRATLESYVKHFLILHVGIYVLDGWRGVLFSCADTQQKGQLPATARTVLAFCKYIYRLSAHDNFSMHLSMSGAAHDITFNLICAGGERHDFRLVAANRDALAYDLDTMSPFYVFQGYLDRGIFRYGILRLVELECRCGYDEFLGSGGFW